MKTMWKKLGKRTGAVLLTALLLSAALPALGIFTGIGETEVQAATTVTTVSVDYVSGSPTVGELPVYGAEIGTPRFKVMGGEPDGTNLRNALEMAEYSWYRLKEGEDPNYEWNWEQHAFGDFFANRDGTPGKWRFASQLRVKDEYLGQYKLDENLTVWVGSIQWTVAHVYSSGDYAIIWSPVYEVELDTSTFHFIDDSEFDINLCIKGQPIEEFSIAWAVTGPSEYSYGWGSGPGWLRVNRDGIVSGTPDTLGTNNDFEIVAFDKNNVDPRTGVALECGRITIAVSPTRTEVKYISLETNIESLVYDKGPTESPAITIVKGNGVRVHGGNWERLDSDNVWKNYWGGSFVKGERYRYKAYLAIETVPERNSYVLAESPEIFDGAYDWDTDPVERGGASWSSYIYAYSPEYTAGDLLYSGDVYIIASAKNPDYVLDVAGGSFMPKANVDIYKRNNTEGQLFTLFNNDDGSWTIMNYKGMALDIAGGSTADKANVQTYNVNYSAAQKYTIKENSDGTYTFINKKSGKALDIAGGKMANKTNVQQYKSNGSVAQKWKLIKMSNYAVDHYPIELEGIFAIKTCADNEYRYALDIAGGSKNNKANVQLYKFNGSDAQLFEVKYRGKGMYSIINKKSGKALDVAGGKAANKQNVQQYTWNGSKAQLWTLELIGECYFIHSALNKNYVLDLAGGKAANKKNIQIYKYNGSQAQKWAMDYRG